MNRRHYQEVAFKLFSIVLLAGMLLANAGSGASAQALQTRSTARAEESLPEVRNPESPNQEAGCFVLDLVVGAGEGTLTAQTPPNCDGGYLGGTVVDLLAEPAEGYSIESWTGASQATIDAINQVEILADTLVSVSFVQLTDAPAPEAAQLTPESAFIPQIGTTFDDATVLGITGSGSGTSQGIVAPWTCGDDNYFILHFPTSQTRTFKMYEDPWDGHVYEEKLRLYNASRGWIKDGTEETYVWGETTNYEHLTYTFSAGTYFLKVEMDSTACLAYHLTWDYDGSSSGSAMDAFWLNETEPLLGFSDRTSADWYYLSYTAGQGIQLALIGDAGTNFDIYVYDQANLTTPLDSTAGYNYPIYVDFNVVSSKTYVRVRRVAGTGQYALQVLPCYSLAASPSPVGAGTITRSVQPNCTHAQKYTLGTPVQLTEQPTGSYHWAGWTGACSGMNTTCNLSITENTSVTANYTANQYPYTPQNPDPSNGLGNVAATKVLGWTGGDPDSIDTVKYTVYLKRAADSGYGTVCVDVVGASCDPAGNFEYSQSYSWYVRAIDNYGFATTGPTWSFNTMPPPNNPPNQPANPNPDNGVGSVPIAQGLSWTGTDPDSGDTVTFTLYYKRSIDPSYLSACPGTSSTSCNPPGDFEYSRTYNWYVVATDNHGASTQGPNWSFTTVAEPNDPPYEATSPTPWFGAPDVPITQVLSWVGGGDPNPGDTVTYTVKVRRTIDASYTTACLDISATSCDPAGNFEYSQDYSWYVIPKDNHGATASATVWSFTTTSTPNNPPNQPTNPTPTNGAPNVPVTQALSWNGGDPDSGDSVTYTVYYKRAIDSSYSSACAGTGSTTCDPSGDFESSQTYNWYVLATDNHTASTQGPTWSFNTGSTPNNAPYQPSVPDPFSGEANVPVIQVLAWTGGDPDAGDTVSYTVYYKRASDGGYSSACSGTGSTSCDPPGSFDPGQLYNWYVVATDNHTVSTQGPTWSFTTASTSGNGAVFRDRFSDSNISADPTWTANNAAYSVLGGVLNSNGLIVDQSTRYQNGFNSSVNIPVTDYLEVTYRGMLKSAGSPQVGQSVQLVIGDFEVNIVRGDINGFSMCKYCIALSLGTGGDVVDLIHTGFQPAYDQFYTMRAVRSGGVWSLYVDGSLIGTAQPSTSITQINYITMWTVGSVAVDDITVATARTSRPNADFDANRTTDLSVFRPSTRGWYIQNQSSTIYGLAGDVPVPGDYDGNGTTDVAVFRPSTRGWFIRNQSSTIYGLAGDVPVPGDYNGDGITDIAVFRPSASGWYIRNQSSTLYGLAGDIPVPGDYNGDGVTEIAVYRPSTRAWYIRGLYSTVYGLNGDIPVPADYNGDGITEIAVYRPSTSAWYVRNVTSNIYGLSGDIPVPGDYNADGSADFAVYRPATSGWFVRGQIAAVYGLPGDYPLPAPDTNADGDPYQ